MASSKVMASSGSANSDLSRQSSVYSLTVAGLQNDQSKNFGSMNMDELLKNMYGDNPAAGISQDGGAGAGNGGGELNGMPGVGNKTVEEVWKEIAGGSAGGGGGDRKIEGVGEEEYCNDPANEEMTLEDFLAKAGAVREEDVRIPQAVGTAQGGFAQMDGAVVLFGNGVERGGGVGRGKKRLVEEPVDKVALRRQKRMIKNRESAARSRERKQAYTVELETSVTQLEEENARLLREEAEQTKKRFRQLMENLIPIQEKRRSPRVLRRVHSMQW